MAGDQQTRKIIDNPDVREIYINKTIGISYDGSTISLTLGCTRVLPERLDTLPRQDQPPSVHVAGRIALSPPAAVELANALNGILADLAKKSSSSTLVPRKPN
jgi:hypothetical protein